MPCDDVQDKIQISYNASNMLEAFSMTKKTCGASVGNALLLSFLENITIDDIAIGSIHRFVPHIEEIRTLDRFLLDKQFSALRAASQVITGTELSHDSLDPAFEISSMELDGDTTHVVGFSNPRINSADVPGCGSCGKDKRKDVTETPPLD